MIDLRPPGHRFVGPKLTRFSPCIRITFRADLLYKSYRCPFVEDIIISRNTRIPDRKAKTLYLQYIRKNERDIKYLFSRWTPENDSQTKGMTDSSPRHTEPYPKNKQSLYDLLKHFPNYRFVFATDPICQPQTDQFFPYIKITFRANLLYKSLAAYTENMDKNETSVSPKLDTQA